LVEFWLMLTSAHIGAPASHRHDLHQFIDGLCSHHIDVFAGDWPSKQPLEPTDDHSVAILYSLAGYFLGQFLAVQLLQNNLQLFFLGLVVLLLQG
jgi:hypothetical protein